MKRNFNIIQVTMSEKKQNRDTVLRIIYSKTKNF